MPFYFAPIYNSKLVSQLLYCQACIMSID